MNTMQDQSTAGWTPPPVQIDGCDTFSKLFRQNCKKFGNKIAIREKDFGIWKEFSWLDYYASARRVGCSLMALGYREGDVAAIISEDNKEWVFADLGIQCIGATTHGLYPTLQEKQVAYQLNDSGAKVLFVEDEEQLDKYLGVEDQLDHLEKVIVFDMEGLRSFQHDKVIGWEEFLALSDAKIEELSVEFERRVDAGDPEDIATLIYTSGTTGNPKGVVLSYNNLAAAAQGVLEVQPAAQQKHRVLSYLPMAHITERSVVAMVSLYELGDIFFNGDLNTFLADLQHAKPTNFVSVPRLWAKFKSQVLAVIPDEDLQTMLASDQGEAVAAGIREKLGLHNAVQFGSGSAPIPPGLLTWFSGIGIDISEGWGMTETSGASCTNMPFSAEQIGTIGKPLSCVEMKLSVDEEILIRGPAIFKEYYNNPEATEEAFVDGWFRTGDKAKINDNGSFQIIGRVKEQFKTAKGKYVAPVPIECLLGALPYVEQVCVLGLGRAQPMAIIVPVPQEGLSNEELKSRISSDMNEVNQQLESHCHLNCILVSATPMTIENGMLTPTLKLKRDKIEAHFDQHLGDENLGVIFV